MRKIRRNITAETKRNLRLAEVGEVLPTSKDKAISETQLVAKLAQRNQ